MPEKKPNKESKEPQKQPKVIGPKGKPEDERKKSIFQLTRMKEHWPDIMKNYSWNPSMSTKQLVDLQQDAMGLISSQNAGSITKKICLSAGAAAEVAAPMIGWDLNGFTAHMSQDPVMNSLMNEMSLKYDSYEALPVELRFAFAFGTSAMAVNNANKEALKQKKEQSYRPTNYTSRPLEESSDSEDLSDSDDPFELKISKKEANPTDDLVKKFIGEEYVDL